MDRQNNWHDLHAAPVSGELPVLRSYGAVETWQGAQSQDPNWPDMPQLCVVRDARHQTRGRLVGIGVGGEVPQHPLRFGIEEQVGNDRGLALLPAWGGSRLVVASFGGRQIEARPGQLLPDRILGDRGDDPPGHGGDG